jgi:hypothetical protein
MENKMENNWRPHPDWERAAVLVTKELSESKEFKNSSLDRVMLAAFQSGASNFLAFLRRTGTHFNKGDPVYLNNIADIPGTWVFIPDEKMKEVKNKI